MGGKWILNNRLVLSFIKLTILIYCGINDISRDISNKSLSVYICYLTLQFNFYLHLCVIN